jgi:hypothetical protein
MMGWLQNECDLLVTLLLLEYARHLPAEKLRCQRMPPLLMHACAGYSVIVDQRERH